MLSPIALYSGAGKHLRTQQNASKRRKTPQNAVKYCKTPQNAAKCSKCSRGRRQFALTPGCGYLFQPQANNRKSVKQKISSLRCFKGENIIITFIISYFEAIFPKWKNIQILTCFMFISISQRKRSLPLRCFKGKNIIIVLIISYLWQFFQNGKISRYSHVLCAFQFHDQIKGG